MDEKTREDLEGLVVVLGESSNYWKTGSIKALAVDDRPYYGYCRGRSEAYRDLIKVLHPMIKASK